MGTTSAWTDWDNFAYLGCQNSFELFTELLEQLLQVTDLAPQSSYLVF